MKSEFKFALINPWSGREYDESVSGFGSFRGNLINNEADAYARVPLVFRAIRLRCNALTRIPIYIFGEGNTEIEKYKFEESLALRDLLWKVEASVLLKGAGYVLKNQNQYGFNKGLQWLNPFTVETKYDNNELKFKQQIGSRSYPEKGWWNEEEMLYFRDFNPLDDKGCGVSAVQVALGDSQIIAGVTRFLGNYFSGDGIPVTMLTMPTGTKDTERERVETWFKKRLWGLRNATARVLGISGEIKVEKLTSDLKEFDFDKIDSHAIQDISDAFEMPQSLLRSASGANRAISDNESRSFLEYTLIPRANYYASILNPFLKEYGQRIEFTPQELPEMQEDETSRATSLKQLVDSGVPLIAALDILGYDVSDSSMRIIRKEYRTKNRERVSSLNQPQPSDESQNNLQIKDEMNKWYRKAKSNFKALGIADVEFESDVIPIQKMEEIELALKAVKTEDELKMIFGGNHV